ncbi:MAG: hypothetical protein FJW39_27735 [Acidobacteria bacterium]|nr:hypothetical protein [Acidobacteriota bacterium]
MPFGVDMSQSWPSVAARNGSAASPALAATVVDLPHWREQQRMARVAWVSRTSAWIPFAGKPSTSRAKAEGRAV